MQELKDKIALVTGAGRGIGKAIAEELAEQGATVIKADIDEKVADVVLDVTNTESINSALETIRAKYGKVDILVNNAGITRDNLMLRMKQDEWDAVISTNLTSVFKVTQAFMKDMLKARWGRIINITSVVGLTGNPGQVNYTAAKAGVVALSKSLAKEVASRGITINNVAPGFVETAMTQKLSAEQRQAILNSVPIQKIADPKDIAYAVTFLASPRAYYITGETIHVNGGMFMV